MHDTLNLDEQEISKFNGLASRWWDPEGDFRPLHDINSARLEYILSRTELLHGPVIDVGCGGGILTEALAAEGAEVVGMDMAERALGVAKLHAHESGVAVAYELATAEKMAARYPAHFHTVTCLEMLEHVPSYADTIKACADLAQAGGNLFFSTINRNPKAYALLILGAEYLLSILPRGTHDYAKFIKPAELCQAIEAAGLEVCDISGMTYNPFNRRCNIARDVDANYIVHASKPL